MSAVGCCPCGAVLAGADSLGAAAALYQHLRAAAHVGGGPLFADFEYYPSAGTPDQARLIAERVAAGAAVVVVDAGTFDADFLRRAGIAGAPQVPEN